jgi:hypothetical protein
MLPDYLRQELDVSLIETLMLMKVHDIVKYTDSEYYVFRPKTAKIFWGIERRTMYNYINNLIKKGFLTRNPEVSGEYKTTKKFNGILDHYLQGIEVDNKFRTILRAV